MSEQEQECEPCRIVGKLCEILEKETGKKRCSEIFDLLKDNKIGPEEARRIMNEEYGSYKVGAALDAIQLERRMKEQDRA
jgi:hypothetical protein